MLNWLIFLFATFLIGILVICYFFLNIEDDEKDTEQKENTKTVVSGPKLKTKLDVVGPTVKCESRLPCLKVESGNHVAGITEISQIDSLPKVTDSETKCNVSPENRKNILDEYSQLQNNLAEKDKQIIGLQRELESERSKSQEWIKEHLQQMIGNFAADIKECIAKPGKDHNQQLAKKRTKENSESHWKREEKAVWLCSKHEFCTLSESHLQFVAERIGPDWKRILRYIEINECVIDNIEIDNQYESVVEKAYQGFSTWLRKSPEVATVCLLIELLEFIERNDIIRALKDQFPRIQDNSNVSPAPTKIYLTSTYHTCGREEEIKIIRDFCDTEQTSKRLLSIAGMPGLGKSELIMEALCHVDRNKIVQPNYYTRGSSVVWKFGEILESILHSWKININKDLTGEVDISDLLQSVDENIILILDITPVRGTPQIKCAVWNFIHNLLRNNESMLKIIVCVCRPPQQIALCNIPAESRLIPNLGETDSITLLQLINPVLPPQQCKDIYKYCGGHPLLLRKLSSKTKRFHNFNEDMAELMKIISDLSLKFDYLNRLLRHSEWPINMKCLMDLMEDNGKVVLAKLCVFVSFIPKASLSFIYSAMTKAEVDILFHDHCLLQMTSGNSAYQILPVCIGFIREYISQDENLYFCEDNKNDMNLSEISSDSLSRVTTFFIQLLTNISMIFFSEPAYEYDDATSEFVNEFRKRCMVCKEIDICKCGDHNMSKAIFFEHKDSIMHFLKKVLSNCVGSLLTIKSPCAVIEFFMYMMKNAESREFLDMKLSPSDPNDEINYVVASAIQMLLNFTDKTYKEGKCRKSIDSYISVLQKQRNIIPVYQEVLFLCYLRRARIHGIIVNSELKANKDLEYARRIYPQNSNIGKMKYHETMADVAFHFKRFIIAKENRSIQLKLTNEQLGEHPFTAEAYFMVGKSLEIFEGNKLEAISNYRKAMEMFTILQDTNMQLEVSSVLSRLIEDHQVV